MKKIGCILVFIGISMIIVYCYYIKHLGTIRNENINEYIKVTSNSDTEEESISDNKNIRKKLDYVAILEIPKVQLKSGLVVATKNFNSINYAISIDKSSQYPNENGNFILYAHSGKSAISFFKRLYQLENDDIVSVYYSGVKYNYKVIRKYEIEKTGNAKVIRSHIDKYITLITCNQNRNGYQIVIEGQIVDEENY